MPMCFGNKESSMVQQKQITKIACLFTGPKDTRIECRSGWVQLIKRNELNFGVNVNYVGRYRGLESLIGNDRVKINFFKDLWIFPRSFRHVDTETPVQSNFVNLFNTFIA